MESLLESVVMMRGNGFKLKRGRLRQNKRKIKIMGRVLRYWHR